MTTELICTVGLPRSGKSTWARTTGLPIVNPDAIRLALHGQRFFGPAEPMVWAIAHLMVASLFKAGHNTVVLDATNVTEKRRSEWRKDAEVVTFKVVETPTVVCLGRAGDENDTEIVPVIYRMTREWDWPGWHPSPSPSSLGSTNG
jgi:predicted kinase